MSTFDLQNRIGGNTMVEIQEMEYEDSNDDFAHSIYVAEEFTDDEPVDSWLDYTHDFEDEEDDF